jgi:hypothetical protein
MADGSQAVRRNDARLDSEPEYCEQAIALDPNFARAYFALGDAYLLLAFYDTPAHEAMPKMRAVARRALEIDRSFPEGAGFARLCGSGLRLRLEGGRASIPAGYCEYN